MAERLGRYLLLRTLATGGMGEIVLAEHTGLSGFAKRVIVKRIRPELARNPAYVELFLNEARVGSFLNHPNIVHIFDVGYEGENLWLVMEYVDGVDLKRLTRRSSLAGHVVRPWMIAAVIVRVLEALEEAHAGGPMRKEPIIHRDVSPENILVSRSGSVKILDFGLAKWMPGQDAVPSMEGNVIFGKTRYMPPEQLRGGLMDVRADLFSLGVVMFEALADVLPFGSGSPDLVLANVLTGPKSKPTANLDSPDPELDAIVLKAIRPRPKDRYQTAREMRDALVAYLETHGPKLPLEGLRRLLQPGSPLARPTGQHDPAGAEHVPTEIGLAVAERCGKCGGEFHAFFHEGLIVDRCTACEGVWLDRGEVARILGERSGPRPSLFPSDPTTPARCDPVVGSCPTCRVGLRAFAVPGKTAFLEICPLCFGAWFDSGEIAFLGDEDVVTWFRTLHSSFAAVS